ncbi:diacylglycerol/polyprenol kinase family protein [Bellilinea sp.]|jgi:phytol kinase|uniref:diacylglycerol/polyprenol kinase family protein n=1 Tax=Bellilinea sp. TaxID=2838785 RepID=UPI002ADDA720|nr:phosphatidate cytidylyltransferase [Bellilinea sp.]
MLGNNWLALAVTFALALLWLRFNDYLAHRGWVSSQLSRKIIHAGTGPIFVLCWLLFADEPSSRWLAALVPFAITVQFFLIGIGVIRDQAAVDGMSRSGDPREILKGPLYYGIVFVILTIVYWYDSPIGITALMMMCGGDGLADVIGKRLPSQPIPWSPRKTWMGTATMFLAGWLFSILILVVFVFAGKFSVALSSLFFPVTILALIATLVESLPMRDIDNLTVPLVCVAFGHLLF